MVRWILPFLVASCFAARYTPNHFRSQSVSHIYYNLGYDKQIEGARWTHYILKQSFINGRAKREDDFRVDPFVDGLSAYETDYRGSGLDRGHLVPAADMKLSRLSMSESFYMSNISPQKPSFNRGKWSALEKRVRLWCAKKGDLHVFTGPVFLKSLNRINGTYIAIPDAFYKIVFKDNAKEAIGFLMLNKRLNGDIMNYKITIDELESLTDIDFLSDLPDFIEDKVESKFNLSYWK